MRPLMTRLVLPLLLLAGAIVPAVTPAAWAAPDAASAPPDAGPKPPAVSVVRVARGALAERVVLTGTLVPREEVVVSPQVEGLAVVEILAEEGDRVAQGQVLARLARDAAGGVRQRCGQGHRQGPARATPSGPLPRVEPVGAGRRFALAESRAHARRHAGTSG